MRIVFIALLLLTSVARADLPTVLSVRCTLTPSSVFNTDFCDGNDGTAAIPLSWATVPNQVITSGSSYSVNLRSLYLTEAGSPAATLSVLSGTLPSGWSLGTDSLSYSGSGTGAAQIVVRATRSAATSDTNAFTVSAEAAVLGESLTEYQIGSFEPAPSSSRTGNDYTLTSAGNGFVGTADQGVMRSIELSGDFTITGLVASLTPNGQDFPQLGLQARETNDQSSAAFGIHASVAGVGVRARGRPVSGGDFASLAVVPSFTLPAYLRLYRSGDTLYSSTSSDGEDYTDIASMVAPWTTMRVGIAAASQTAVEISGAIDDVVITGTAPSAETPPTEGIKWHPGHYVLPYVGDRANYLSYISQLSSDTNIKGIKIRLYWADLEGAQGDYTAGIALVRSYLAAAGAVGKRLIVVVLPTKYGTSRSGIVPTYITTDAAYSGGLTTTAVTDRVSTRVWDANVITRMIALSDAYGAEFNDEPYFEGFEIGGETALGNVVNEPGYSSGAFDTQLRRLMTAARAGWPNTNLFLHANYYKAGLSLMPALIQHAQSLDFVWAGPDVLPDTGYPGNSSGNGPTDGDNVLTGVVGGVDYRGDIAVGPDSQSPSYGGKEGSYLYSEIQTYAASLGSNYIIWTRGVPSSLVTQFDRSDMTEAAYESAVSWAALQTYLSTATATVQTCPSNMTCNTN